MVDVQCRLGRASDDTAIVNETAVALLPWEGKVALTRTLCRMIRISVVAVATFASVASALSQAEPVHRGAPPPPQETDAGKPVLYALLIGVAGYQNPALQIGYSAQDATDLASALKAQSGGIYRDVKIRLLTDRDATVAAMKNGLDWLQKETTNRDLAIVFLAGHGVTDAKKEFWFLTYEADVSRLSSTAVSRHEILDALHDLRGKKILFLDVCHAGPVLLPGAQIPGASVDLNTAINDFATAESGFVVYGASVGRELSIESDAWKHGAFTKALIEAIGEGKADILHRGKITTALLDVYLAERVRQLTDGRQHPVMSRPATVPDFAIAIAR
jgi:uncharacterized caspase-like protein